MVRTEALKCVNHEFGQQLLQAIQERFIPARARIIDRDDQRLC